MPGYDLHTHTNRSDGTNTPAENVTLGVERGLEGLGVTDHDTTEGFEEALAAADGSGLEIVPGLELSAEYDGASLHVLAYWVDPSHRGLREELLRLTDTRFRRGEMMIEKLQALGHDVSFERVRELAGDDLIARPHVAQAMVEAGIVATEEEAFDRFISDDGPAARLDLVATGASDCHGARYGYRMGCETTDGERYRELKRRAGRA